MLTTEYSRRTLGLGAAALAITACAKSSATAEAQTTLEKNMSDIDWKNLSQREWKERLTPMEFNVLRKEGITNEVVLSTIASIPRELFLPDALAHKAYENTALPIGQGQTISQPYIVAKMTELLLSGVGQQAKVLEIGTGSGYQTAGIPSNIAVVRSLQQSLARRTAMTAGKRRELNSLMEQLDKVQMTEPAQPFEETRLKEEIAELRKKIESVPFIDTFDLRYKNYEKRPIPSSQAVMFCLMDVSGSMDQATKDIAKRFYVLLYLFLNRTYENVDVVFIRHHTQAKEVDEHEFFYSQETGGTIVSSALKLMDEIVAERYPSNEWNIYAAQASDGDNWADDSPRCKELLINKLLPTCQYYSYIEITRRSHQTLWHEYEKLEASFDNFAMKNIKTVDDIFPVFRELFQKETA